VSDLATTTSFVEKLFTYKATAEVLGVTERTVFTLVATGQLPAVRFGRSVRIDPADLRAYIDRCKSTTRESSHGPRPAVKEGGAQ